jgi:hypothetical protein
MLGIDIGSTTVKVALMDEDMNILFSDYRRHFANIRETLSDLIEDAFSVTGDVDVSPMITGSGGLTLSDSLMAEPIKTCCATMKTITTGGDELLATAIGTGILAMTSAGTVNTDVTGVTTSPQGSPVPPSSGKAKGTITCQNADLISSLIQCFKDMKDNAFDEGFDGDDYFAGEMADYVNDYFTAGVIATSGQGALSGTTGAGSIS